MINKFWTTPLSMLQKKQNILKKPITKYEELKLLLLLKDLINKIKVNIIGISLNEIKSTLCKL